MRLKNRILPVLFCVFVFICLSFLTVCPAYAEAYGEAVIAPTFVGYVANQTGDITAADARAVLLKSAGLAELPDTTGAVYAADADFDGEITAKDARIILRVSAGLDMFNIRLKSGETFRFGYIENRMTSHIDFETSSDKLKVERQIVYPSEYAPGWIGAMERHTFIITQSEHGEYVFTVVRFGYVNEPINTNTFKISVE